jgi:hypothetical protein
MAGATDTGGIAEQLSSARDALLTVARAEPERWWSAEELRSAAQNGFPSTVISVALNDLVDRHQLRLNSRLLIQFAQ